MKKITVIPLIKETILALTKNSVGSNIFRNLFAKVNGIKQDILEDGKKSCAAFTSAILLRFGLIKEGHATIDGAIRDMESSGWYKIKRVRKGCVLVWEPIEIEGEANKHIGFYIGGQKAISNNFAKRTPQIHHWTYGNSRKIISMYWHDKLND